MKVLLLNGSPHENGCIFTSLSEISATLQAEGIESEILWIGTKPVQGCTACGKCKSGSGCVFKDELYSAFTEKMQSSDAIIIGSPVYYAGAPGSLCAILDRTFYSAAGLFRHKPAACVVNCRRGGASSTFDRLNKYFTLLQMPIVSSQYWNSTHGSKPEDVKQDLEGLQTMRTLARNMAYMLKTMKDSTVPRPEPEPHVVTSFIR